MPANGAAISTASGPPAPTDAIRAGRYRQTSAGRMTSLLYLAPAFVAPFAWLLFGETLGPLALAGMAVAVLGVALVNR